MNIGIITQEGELVVPPFEQALAGCTLKRLLHLLQEVSSEVSWALPPALADIQGAKEEERPCQCHGVFIPDAGNRSLQLFQHAYVRLPSNQRCAMPSQVPATG